MTSESLFEIIVVNLKRRWARILFFCLLVYPLAISVMRTIDFPYTAQITLLALPQANQSILDNPTSALFGSGTSIDRQSMLLGQESLLGSNRLFAAVRKVDPTLRAKDYDPINDKHSVKLISTPPHSITGQLQEIIFGRKYVETRQRWKDPYFGAFKRRIGVKVDLDAAIMVVTYKHSDPEIALASVQTAADELQVIDYEIAKSQSAKKVAFLAEKLEESKLENDRINDAITEFSRKNKFSSDPRTIEPRFKGASEATELVTQAKLEIAQREVALKEIKRISSRLQDEIKQGLINDREGRLKTLTSELRQYDQAIGNGHSLANNKANAALKKQIAVVRSKISQELSSGDAKMDVSNLQSLLTTNESSIHEQEAAISAAKKQLEFGESLYKKFDRQLSVIPELSANLSKLTLVQIQQRKVLETLTQRYLEAQIESDTKLEQFYVTEKPSLVDGDKLGKLPILLSLLILLTVVVISGSVVTDLLRGIILQKQQLMKFQVPHYLGAIPYEASLQTRRAHAVISELGVGFRMAHSLKKMLFDQSDHRAAKVIAVTSKNAKIGKTISALGIATGMQARGLKTIIIDADYYARDRALKNHVSDNTKIFHIKDFANQPDSPIDIRRQKLAVWSLREEFQSDQEIEKFLMQDFAKSLSLLKTQYDCIVIDCAPCFIPSMLLVYEHADVNVLCFAEGQSSVSDVETATEILEPTLKAGACIVSLLTRARLNSNVVSATVSDGFYYKARKAA